MENSDQAFTTGIWNVKKGKEQEFISEWTRFAETSNESDGVTARLLQDKDNPQRFISVGIWGGEDVIQKWRDRPETKAALQRLTELLEEPSKPKVMKEVAKVGEHEIA
jgi:heme-degrading monooxygenase HmoA